MNFLQVELTSWLVAGLVLGVTSVIALIAHRIIFLILKRGAERTGSIADKSFVAHARRPVSLLLPLAVVLIVFPSLPVTPDIIDGMRHLVTLGMIGAVAWFAINLTAVYDDVITSKFRVDVQDNLLARQVHTRTRVIRRIAIIGILIVAVSAMLMTFPSIRHIGISVFASAGVAGVIVGMAARPMLSNIIAGIQIAVTQPIRIDDVVVLEGEWGRIEEIGSTQVVVCLWDKRRLVVPLSYFIERPIQNWTYKTADVLGSVLLYTDYTVPVEELRTELYRLLQTSDMWDGNVWSLQVTNATEHAVELRALMSAVDSATVWNLRCHVRENLIRFLQEQHPQSLPKIRTEIREKPHGRGGAGAGR